MVTNKQRIISNKNNPMKSEGVTPSPITSIEQ